MVLGGIIQREESEVERKIPILGDIPVLGWYLFRKKDTVAKDKELMVFLRSRVTRSWADVEELLREEGRKTPLIQEWDERREEERREAEGETPDDENEKAKQRAERSGGQKAAR